MIRASSSIRTAIPHHFLSQLLFGGIYIPPNSNCDKKWWSIAVRIEDDALITEKGYELLSVFAPRKVEDIEKMIAEKSALDNFTVPKLKSAEKKAF